MLLSVNPTILPAVTAPGATPEWRGAGNGPDVRIGER